MRGLWAPDFADGRNYFRRYPQTASPVVSSHVVFSNPERGGHGHTDAARDACPPDSARWHAGDRPAKPKAARHAKGGAQAAKGAPVKGKAAHKATPAKNAPPAKKAAAAAPVITAARPGSKTAQVVATLQRKNGATLPACPARCVAPSIPASPPRRA